MVLDTRLIELLRRRKFAKRARSVYTTLHVFVTYGLPHKKAIDTWRELSNASEGKTTTLLRSLTFKFLHLPIAAIMAIPTFGLILFSS